MTPALLTRARRLAAEHDRLDKASSEAANFTAETARSRKRVAELAPVAAALARHDDVTRQLAECRSLASDAPEGSDGGSPDGVDDELRELAREEVPLLEASLAESTSELRQALTPRHPRGDGPAVLEIRAGVGGGEAALFANDLLVMYERLSSAQGWTFRTFSTSALEGSVAGEHGITEAIVALGRPGQGVFEKLRFEAGVHRVQRTPATEQKGRVHTSTASVHVLPELSDAEVDAREDGLLEVDESEVKLEVMRSRGAGGQHVNRTESAVRLTHLPTGIQVSMQDSRSQHANKRAAWLLLRSKIAEGRRAMMHAEQVGEKRAQVSGGVDRSEKCRTYNYAQNRVTDHRANISSHSLDAIMRGDAQLLELIESVHAHMIEAELQRALEVDEGH
ncbi:Peptide chain release factor 1, mitochondrial [Savitreella phatthalungensis]